MAEFENIAKAILRLAKEDGARPAIVLPQRTVSFARLRDMVLAFAYHARRNGIGHDSLVAIDIDNVVTRPAIAAACALVGAAWVDATPAVIRQRKLAYTHLLYGAAKSHEASPTALRVDESWSTAPSELAPWFDAGPDDIWTYTQSSGTTGTPKFTAVPHRLVVGGGAAGVQGFVLREGERPVFASLAPAGARGSASTAIRVLAFGGTMVLGADIELMLKSGVNRVTGSPVQFAKLLEGKKKRDAKIYGALLGGAAASESLFARMLDFFEQVQFLYASTEVGVVAARVVDRAPVDPTNVGKVFPSVEVMVVDAQERAVPAGTDGILRIRRADRRLAGYVGADEATKAVFRDGWFYPGDIGRLSENGELHIVGRTDDRLDLGGVKVDAGRVDNIIQNVSGVRDGYCFEDRNDAGASYLAILLDIEDGIDAHGIVQAIHDGLNATGHFYRIRRVYLSDDIPRTMTGKPVRRLAPEFVREQKPFNVALRQPEN